MRVRYPFRDLPGNLAAFCASLRRDLHFSIGPRELADAARGLELAELGSEREVRNVLRPILSKTVDDARAFDEAFDRFFRTGSPAVPPPDAARGVDESVGAAADPTAATTETDPLEGDRSQPDVEDRGVGAGAIREVDEGEDGVTATLLRASYSPLDGHGEALVLEPPTRPWLEAAAALTRRVHAGASRRWRPAHRGPRFDFRRTLRGSLHTGGEPVTPRWRAHPKRNPRFVLLIDGSRSMGSSAVPALRTAVALSAVSLKTETFAFSTLLRRVSRDVHRAAAGERRILQLRQAWGGGTTIGACIDEFVRQFGERLLGPDTVVIIASDGLDVGNPELLRQVMAGLARRSAAVVWLNPLLATPGYEPTATGMSLARPHISRLSNVSDPKALGSLARTLTVR